jgi:hypothetical protein
MNRIDIYEYDKRNRDDIVKSLLKNSSEIISWSYFSNEEKQFTSNEKTSYVYIDISSLFYNEEKTFSLISSFEIIINSIVMKQKTNTIFLMIERKYSLILKNLLYFKVDKILSLENKLNIDVDPVKNIVDLSEIDFRKTLDYVNKNLFGNLHFRERLEEELSRFRVFNKMGYETIFSTLICGASGIGKTETARLLHNVLAPNEPQIKINFGNYSAEQALSSLIGSPRGYIGSNTGELTEKLANSRSKVIIIDEFEKASKPVYNFFLQLLEEGVFTDSMGREYNLNKYIIIFTSNMQSEDVDEYLPPELSSRFSFKCALSPLYKADKNKYIDFKVNQIVTKLANTTKIVLTKEEIKRIKSFDSSSNINLRDVNAEIMQRVTTLIYPKIFINN